MKVLIFDDVLHGQQGAYQVPGLTLSFHAHGDDAEAAVRAERPDLVCMDFAMDARRSGAEAVRALRACDVGASLRIVAISSDREFNERLLDAGADDAVPKSHLRGYLWHLRGPG